MKRPRVMSVDGRRMVDPTAMEAYCIGAESTINELEARLTEAEGMLRDARAFMPVEYQATVDALLNATKEDT